VVFITVVHFAPVVERKKLFVAAKAPCLVRIIISKIKFLNRTTEYVLNIKTNFFMILIP